MSETVLLIRDGQPLRFTGELLLDYEARDPHPSAVRWFSVKLWRTGSGKLIAEVSYHTKKKPEYEQPKNWVFGPFAEPETLIDELDEFDCHQGVSYWPERNPNAVKNQWIEASIDARWDDLLAQVRLATGQIEEVA